MDKKMNITKIIDKNEKELKSIIKKLNRRVDRLHDFKTTASDFGIELNTVQLSTINEKMRIYGNLAFDTNNYHRWKYVDLCETELIIYHMKGFSEDLGPKLKTRFLREEKLKRINDIFDTNI